jgi:hypothetical protein
MCALRQPRPCLCERAWCKRACVARARVYAWHGVCSCGIEWVKRYVYMCVCVYMYHIVCGWVCACKYIYITHTHKHTHTHTNTHIYVCMYGCMYVCMRVGLVVCVRVCVWLMTLAVSLGPRRGAGGAAVPAPEGYSEYSHGELEGYSEYSHRGRGRRGLACAVRTVTGAGIRRNPGLTVGHMLPAILQRNATAVGCDLKSKNGCNVA